MKKARKWKLIVGIPIFLSVFLLAFFTALNSDDFFEIDFGAILASFLKAEREQALEKTPTVSDKTPKIAGVHPITSVSFGDYYYSNEDTSKFIISVIFSDGFVYLFIPTFETFFEIDIYKSLLNFEQYYMIYNELDSILSIVEHLNLDSNTGL